MRFYSVMAEIYKGIKFNYESIGKTISETDLLPELKKWCLIFNENKLAPAYSGGSSGNLSFRIKPSENRFIITASHTALRENMSDNDFTEVIFYDKKNNTITGKGIKTPSSESILHYLIYKNRPDVNAVFHGHSLEILKNAKHLNIPVTEKEFPYGTTETATETLKLIKNHNFVIIKNHGFISCGRSLKEAGTNAVKALNDCKSIK